MENPIICCIFVVEKKQEMKNTFNTLSQDLENLEQKRQELISQMKEIASSYVKEASKENPNIIKRCGTLGFTVSLSTLSKKGWSPTTIDWERSVDLILAFLDKHPVITWKDVLTKKMNSATGPTVPFKEKVVVNGYKKVWEYAIDKEFLERIINKF